MTILGVDVGGSGIKGALVNTETGSLITDRHRIPTPDPSTPHAVADAIHQLAKSFDYKGPIGVGFPSVIHNGIAKTASNIHKSWISTNARELFSLTTGCEVTVLNDADAAGLAEMTFGTGKDHRGTVLLVTIGTGIGTVLFVNGTMVPNLEMGHIFLHNGYFGEKYASDAVRKAKDLSWSAWAKRMNVYLKTMEDLTWPDLIIIGGGVSKKQEKFFPQLKLRTPFVAAHFRNEAGIIGAALAAGQNKPKK
ncbi:MAG: ROK family protein [Bacteroidetes bacterium]|nr:ROK family protein [Bacteroidota bacterium]